MSLRMTIPHSPQGKDYKLCPGDVSGRISVFIQPLNCEDVSWIILWVYKVEIFKVVILERCRESHPSAAFMIDFYESNSSW